MPALLRSGPPPPTPHCLDSGRLVRTQEVIKGDIIYGWENLGHQATPRSVLVGFCPTQVVAPICFHGAFPPGPKQVPPVLYSYIRKTKKMGKKENKRMGEYRLEAPPAFPFFPHFFFVSSTVYCPLVYPCGRTGTFSSRVSTRISPPCLHSETAPCSRLSRPTPCRSRVDIIPSHVAVLSPQRSDSNYYSGHSSSCFHEC